MTRFIMTTSQAADLIMQAACLARGGEVFVSKMPAARIPDLARVMVEELAPAYGYDPEKLEIRQIGAKPGEKLYEELLTEDEAGHSLELDDLFVTVPAFRGLYNQQNFEFPGSRKADRKPYTSAEANCLELEELREFVRKHGILEPFLPGGSGESD
jgi:FlaA1/EpsC-like NDP-sugar epimerase